MVSVAAVAPVVRWLPPIRGRGRLAYELHRRVARARSWAPDDQWTIAMRLGHTMQVPISSAQSWTAAFTGGYDDPKVALLSDLIEPETIVLDVGASLGFYTVPLGVAAAGVRATVLAVEPLQRNVDVLRQNLRLNHLEEVVQIAAVGAGRKRGQLGMRTEDGGVGNASIVSDLAVARQSDHFAAGPQATVSVERLDDMLNGRCSVIKIDVEGYEMEALAGAERVIAESRPVILGEFSVAWLRTRECSVDAPFVWAAQHGYEVYEVRTRRLSPLTDRCTVDLVPTTATERQGQDLLMRPR